MRLSAILAAVVLALVAAPAEAGRKTVRVGDNYFVRPAGVPTVKASKGTTVTWRWRGSAPHNVTVRRSRMTGHVVGVVDHASAA